jgi:glycosyltransferase involved in cell wall biosynthesis
MAVKIMYLMDDFQGPHAGTEGQLLQLLRHLDRSRYEPSITFLRGAEYALRNPFPCPVRVLGVNRLASVRTIAGMLRYAFALRREGYRLVHCIFNDASLIAPFFLKLAGIRVLVSRRDMGFWYTPGILLVLRLVARFVDCYVANSRMVKRCVQEQERVPGDRITVIYNGYARYEAGAAAKQAGSSLAHVANGAPVVGVVANLKPIKRIDTLVEAFATVGSQVPAARLVVVGDSSTPEGTSTLRDLEALADRLGIRERVSFTGRVAAPMEYVEKFSVAVLCSESEGFSNAIVEYMQAARPVVCTDTGGNPEIVQDGRNGFLVPVGDSGALAERLVQVLSDSMLAKRLGEAGRETVRSFTHERMLAEQMSCYDKVLAGRLPAT